MSRSQIRSGCSVFAIALALVLAPYAASANGRFPATTNVRFQPGNDSRILLPTTFGLLLSEDNGASFRWICEETVGYGGTFDPDYAITTEGNIYATTLDGLKVSTDNSCTYTATEFYGDLTGGTALDPITGHWVGEVELAADGKIWAATSTGGAANDVYVSSDGTTFNSANNWHATAWWKTLRVAKSNPDVVYVSGFQIGDGETPAFALLYKTIDGGANWTDLGVSGFAFGGQPSLFIEAVSPTNPNIVFARVRGAREPQGDDIYRSIDGGTSWTKVLEMHGTVSAFVVRADESVLVGTATACTEDISVDTDASVPNKGCLRVSADGAVGSWTTPAQEPKLGCLGERPSDQSLFACGSNWDPDNFSFGRTPDDAQSWDKVMRFIDIAGPLDCPAETQQDSCETLRWPSLCLMFGICTDGGDAGAVGPDASVAIIDPSEDGGCFGCQSSGLGGLTSIVLVLGLYVLLFRRREQS